INAAKIKTMITTNNDNPYTYKLDSNKIIIATIANKIARLLRATIPRKLSNKIKLALTLNMYNNVNNK
ncbi:hypothetical protein JVW19_25895, partial [Vibrio cholerae O1]|nr:hypothetical protein [Vibrio cholerae O1]